MWLWEHLLDNKASGCALLHVHILVGIIHSVTKCLKPLSVLKKQPVTGLAVTCWRLCWAWPRVCPQGKEAYRSEAHRPPHLNPNGQPLGRLGRKAGEPGLEVGQGPGENSGRAEPQPAPGGGEKTKARKPRPERRLQKWGAVLVPAARPWREEGSEGLWDQARPSGELLLPVSRDRRAGFTSP